MSINFAEVNRRLAANMPSFCQHFLPGGTTKGDWYVVRSPWREDKNPSFGVHLVSGRYKDFGRPDVRGDATDLNCKLRKMTPSEVARSVGL